MRASVLKNKGMILAKSKNREIIIDTRIYDGYLEFSFGHSILKTRIFEPFCEAEVSRPRDSFLEKKIFDGIKPAIKYLVKDEQVEFNCGIMHISGYPFSLVVIQNGFILHLEITPHNFLSFGVIHQNGGILLAKQEGEWSDKRDEQEIIDICSGYHDALDKIIQEADTAFTDTVREYDSKHLVN